MVFDALVNKYALLTPFELKPKHFEVAIGALIRSSSFRDMEYTKSTSTPSSPPPHPFFATTNGDSPSSESPPIPPHMHIKHTPSPSAVIFEALQKNINLAMTLFQQYAQLSQIGVFSVTPDENNRMVRNIIKAIGIMGDKQFILYHNNQFNNKSGELKRPRLTS